MRTRHAVWVQLPGVDESPRWYYVLVEYRDGKPDFSVQPRWATSRNVVSKRVTRIRKAR